MVCLGNICRSPLAEGILKSKLDPVHFTVESAGTGGYHVGAAPDERSIAIAAKYGIDITDQKAATFSPYHFEIYDYIYVMDTANYHDVIKLANSDLERKKVRLILNETNPGTDQSVPDPYYGGTAGFEKVYELLEAACTSVAARLTK